MPEPEYLTATLPLFEAGHVDCIEWSFDMSWRPGLPDWLAGLIADYEAADRLSGHGVSLSPLSSHPRQDAWFERFGQDVTNHRFTHVSEHFGFMAAGDYRLGPPLPLPMTTETLGIGRKHLERLAALTDGPVGLENLAFAFGTKDVWTQGDFLESLLASVDGFLVLDVHNLWCQIVNFDLDVHELLATYPVDRVRECHVSGGSWSEISSSDDTTRTIRRDTHDDAVPEEVFALLGTVLDACPKVETVIVERIGSTLASPEAAASFRDDFARVRQICEAPRPNAPRQAAPRQAVPRQPVLAVDAPTHPGELMAILDAARTPEDAVASLRDLGDSRWCNWIDAMQPAMVATAIELMATWGRANGDSANGDSANGQRANGDR